MTAGFLASRCPSNPAEGFDPTTFSSLRGRTSRGIGRSAEPQVSSIRSERKTQVFRSNRAGSCTRYQNRPRVTSFQISFNPPCVSSCHDSLRLTTPRHAAPSSNVPYSAYYSAVFPSAVLSARNFQFGRSSNGTPSHATDRFPRVFSRDFPFPFLRARTRSLPSRLLARGNARPTNQRTEENGRKRENSEREKEKKRKEKKAARSGSENETDEDRSGKIKGRRLNLPW